MKKPIQLRVGFFIFNNWSDLGFSSVLAEPKCFAMPLTTKIKINHIAVHVSNLERSRVFYEEVLEIQPIEEPFKDGLHAWYAIGGGASVHLIEELHLSPPGEISKTNHLCFSVADIQAFIENLKRKNWAFENWAGDQGEIHVRPDGIKQIFFRDPDNYWIEVNDDF